MSVIAKENGPLDTLAVLARQHPLVKPCWDGVIASRIDDEYELVCGAFSSDAEKAKPGQARPRLGVRRQVQSRPGRGGRRR